MTYPLISSSQNTGIHRHSSVFIHYLMVTTLSLFAVIMASSVQAKEELPPFEIRVFTQEMYHAGHHNWAVTQDHRGMIYVGNTEGLLEYDSLNWRLISLPEKMGVTSLLTDKTGRIYVGSYGEIGYLAPDADGMMHYVSLRSKFPESAMTLEDPVIKIMETENEVLFLSETTIFIWADEMFRLISSGDHFYGSIYTGKDLYVIDSETGFSRIEQDQLIPVPNANFFRGHQMLPFKEDKILIFTLSKGLLIYDTKVSAESDKNGRQRFSELLDENKFFSEGHFLSSGMQLSEHRFVLGTIKQGLVVLNEEGHLIQRINKSNGFPSNDIYGLHKDNLGNIWIATSDGIVQIVLKTSILQPVVVEEPVDSETEEVDDTSANAEEEEAAEEEVIPANEERVATSNQFLFASLIRSVEIIDDDSRIFGGTFFQEIGGLPSFLESDLNFRVLPFNQNGLRFSFGSNDLVNSAHIRYQTYLKGMDNKWSKPSDRTFREYTNLTWRNYTFHVRALRPDGSLSQRASFSFEVLPPWYETWWFSASQVGVLLFLLLIAGLLRGSGKTDKIADGLVAIVVMVVFGYFDTQTEVYIDELADDITFVKVLIMVGMGLTIDPIQEMFKSFFARISLDKALFDKKENDELTGLKNRTSFTKGLKEFVEIAKKEKSQLCLIFFDVDFFKSINETYSLEGGDLVLKEVGKILKKNSRDHDLVARFWGEKFMFAMHKIDTKMGYKISERIRQDIESHEFKHNDQVIKVTSSCGVASYPDVCSTKLTAEELIKYAEQALTYSKVHGRNQTSCAPVPA
ncbi:MAG: GGDEF domain-containing protein [SAR324 cluster bacterium]|nr:GGDEF domain-containing protein [SAR324 cluster bacterium]